MSICPTCGRPVALARPTCLYCGQPLPAALVAQAEAARRALEEQAPGPGSVEPAAEPGPAGVGAAAPGRGRAVVLIEASRADPQGLSQVLGLPAYEAGQRTRRRGWQLLRLGAAPGEHETAALRAAGAQVTVLGESDVRAAVQPIVATGGHWSGGRLHLRTDAADLTLAPGELLLVVRGTIVRQFEAAAAARGGRVVGASWRHLPASLEPGQRTHLHHRDGPRAVELDPHVFEFGHERPSEAPALTLARWAETLAAGAPLDEGFRYVTPALAPAEAERGAAAGVVDTLRRTRGRAAEPRAVHDNLAQFRFYSAWRGLLERQHG